MQSTQLDAESIIAAVGAKLAEERAARVALQSSLEALQRVPGPQGERGLPGQNGEAGERGATGPEGPPGPQAELSAVPDDVAELVAKAIAVLKESPAPATPALVLNINTAAASRSKTITTRRDAAGNLVAEVTEQG